MLKSIKTQWYKYLEKRKINKETKLKIRKQRKLEKLEKEYQRDERNADDLVEQLCGYPEYTFREDIENPRITTNGMRNLAIEKFRARGFVLEFCPEIPDPQGWYTLVKARWYPIQNNLL